MIIIHGGDYDDVNHCEVDSLHKEDKDDTTNVVNSVVPFDWSGCE